MADDVTVSNSPLTDYSVKTDEDGGGDHWQLIKLGFGGDGVFTRVESGVGLPVGVVGSVAVTDGGGSLTVDGTVSISGTVAIGDGSDTVEVLLSGADSTSNTDNELITAALGYLFNGTGWDRARGDITNGLDVDVTRVSGTVTVDSELPAAAALTDGFANPTVPGVGAFGMVWDGSTWDRMPGTAEAGVLVQGGAANDAPTDGNPVLVGERASTAVPTAVGSDGDVVFAWSDRRGARKVVMVDDAGDSIMDGTNDALRVNVVAGSGGATQYAEDTASAAGESVIMVGVVRKDSAASLVDADSDRTELQVDASGALRVTGGGGGTEYTEDIASPADPVGGAVLLRRRDTPASEASAAGDWVAQNATQYGAGYVQILTSAGAFVDSFGGGVQYTEGDIDTTITGTALMWEDISNTLVVASAAKPLPVDVGSGAVNTELPDAAFLADNTANPSVPGVGAYMMGFDGTNWDRVRAPGGVVEVSDAGGSLTVDGTVAVSGTVTVSATDLDIRNLDVAQDDVRVAGMAANDAAVADNPVAVGGRASAAAPTDVSADGDAVWAWHLRNGAQATVLTAAGALIGGDATNGLDVDVTRVQGSVTVTATDLDIRNLDVAQDDVRVGGMAALDAAVADNPVAIGGRASTAVPTAVSADGDAVWAWLDRQGAQKTVMVDDAGDSAMDGANNALRVNVVAGAAGGTQYTEGDIDASITGTAILWEDASDTLATVSESNPLPVIIWDGVDVVGVSSDNKLRVETVADEVEDSAIGNGQGGFAILGMRNDAAASRTDADGDATFMATDAAGRVGIADLGGSITVDGTVTVNQGTAGTAWEVVGDVAHDAAAPANPVVVGAQMETIADSAPGTRAGTDGDAVKLASADGAIFVAGRGPQSWQTRLASTSTVQTDGSIHSAPGSGLSLYVTDIIFSIGVATASSIFFEEGASTVLGPWYLEAIAGRGMALHFQTPFKVTANTALTVTNTGATTYSILVLGFTAPG